VKPGCRGEVLFAEAINISVFDMEAGGGMQKEKPHFEAIPNWP
jgi:hypothetical protein